MIGKNFLKLRFCNLGYVILDDLNYNFDFDFVSVFCLYSYEINEKGENFR